MTTKNLLCIALHDGAAARATCAALSGWHVAVVETVADASTLVRQHAYRVGLLFGASERHAVMLERLLCACPDMEWIGMFDAAALASTQCRELISTHLHDFHT